jgi:asparagine synthase (glutamine-hydrolysing)
VSGIVGLFPSDAAPIEDGLMPHMLGRMPARGSEYRGVWQGEGAALAVSRHGWERGAGLSGDGLVVQDEDLSIAADASLYYRKDLLAKLTAAGALPRGDTPSHLILAAYRAWGDQCAQYLEGDYAFILWDSSAQSVFCARDFSGSRPLFYAHVGRTLIVASTLAALRAYPDFPDDLNAMFLAETAANLLFSAHETAYAAATAIPAGSSLARTGGGTTCVARHWRPPPVRAHPTASFAAAAEELRHRVSRAVEERLAPAGVTSVWMSGGRDSTAVFGAGQDALRRSLGGRQLHPVSVSYPHGHPGREDEFIAAVADHAHAPVHWLQIGDIPFFDRPDESAARRDEPYGPVYETFNRALAQGSRAVGARVALDGWGGDQLFESSPIHLADLFRTGRWLALAREWRAFQVQDLRYFITMAIAPTLPSPVRAAATWLRGGRELRDPTERRIPDWLSKPLVTTLADRQRQYSPGRGDNSFAGHELYMSLTAATMARVRGWLTGLALEEGIEVRSPLYDGRIVELAAQRPDRERRSGRDTKMLLRAAMRGLLPAHVLAPRQIRTGVPGDYFANAMRSTYPQLLRTVLDSCVLADLGIVDPGAWRRSAEACLSQVWNDEVGTALLLTLQTELWLRARSQGADNSVEQTSAAAILVGYA